MGLIVKLDKVASEAPEGKFYPEAGWGYISKIVSIEKEKTAKSKQDILNITTQVLSPSGEIYEEKYNGPSILYNKQFSANVGRLIKAAVESKENEGTIDKELANTLEPDVSKLVGMLIGTKYAPQYNNANYASVDRVVPTDKIDGLYDENMYNKWKAGRAANKNSGASSTGSTSTASSADPFAQHK